MLRAVHSFFHLVERRIAEAEAAGAFRDLPGAGRPLALEDLSAVAEELRAGYLLLKGNGFLPPELEAKKEWLRLEDLLAACGGDGASAATALRSRTARARQRYEALCEQHRGR